MRGRWPSVLVLVSLVVSCGGDENRPSATEPPGPTTVPTATAAIPTTTDTTVGTTAPSSTIGTTVVPPSTTTTVSEVEDGLRFVLRPDGLGPIDFGTPGDQAIATLTQILGPPDRDDSVDPDRQECVEGSGWRECVPVFDTARILTWTASGLDVLVTDLGYPDGAYPRRVATYFGAWRAVRPSNGAALSTADGIGPGITVGALRAIHPEIEFGFGEGILSAVYVAAPNGDYWGGFEWNDTAADHAFPALVRAVQRALNEHGAELAVDGEWGPRTQQAWDQFLADHGFSPIPVMWIEPEIAEALGLVPDELIVAELGATGVVAGAVDHSGSIDAFVLRSDGFDGVDFGDPVEGLFEQLRVAYGPPSEEMIESAEPPGPFQYLPYGYWAAYQIGFVEWDDPGLSFVVSDMPYRVGEGFGEPTPGTLTLVSWRSTARDLRFANGIGIGSTLGELHAAYPDLVVGTMDLNCETEYLPAVFLAERTDTSVPDRLGLRGSLDWDWVGDVQTALDERGAELVVDGIYGPATTAALREFQLESGIISFGEDANGIIGPLTMDALALSAPDTARVISLGAGYPGSC